MQIWQGNLITALRGIQEFLDKHADVLGTIPKSGARQTLDAQVAEMSAHSVTQDDSHVAAKNATRTQNALRQTVLRDHMAPVARVAAAALPPGPEIAALTLPKRRLSTQQLYAAASAMANVAEPHAEIFTGRGLPDDFLAQLRSAANDLLVPVDSRTQNRIVRKGATASMKVQASNARKNVRILDALVQKQIKNDANLLTQWLGVRRPNAKTAKAGVAAPATPAASAPVIPAPTTPAITANA